MDNPQHRQLPPSFHIRAPTHLPYRSAPNLSTDPYYEANHQTALPNPSQLYAPQQHSSQLYAPQHSSQLYAPQAHSLQQYAPPQSPLSQYTLHQDPLPLTSPQPPAQQQATSVTAHSPPQTYIGTKRTRNSRACDFCHDRSMKCDGNPNTSPGSRCQNCVDWGRSCRYDRPVRKRGIQPGAKVTKDGRPLRRGNSGRRGNSAPATSSAGNREAEPRTGPQSHGRDSNTCDNGEIAMSIQSQIARSLQAINPMMRDQFIREIINSLSSLLGTREQTTDIEDIAGQHTGEPSIIASHTYPCDIQPQFDSTEH
ncbi:hypothetical protein ACMFMG_003657 [Clarireedia jacksonii]